MGVLTMARPARRPRSSSFQFRKRLPSGVIKKAAGQRIAFPLDVGVVVTATVGKEAITFSLKTSAPSTAKARHGRAAARLEQFCQAIRRGPQPLTKKQRVALSGLLYRAFADGLDEDPGDPEVWQHVNAANEAVVNG